MPSPKPARAIEIITVSSDGYKCTCSHSRIVTKKKSLLNAAELHGVVNHRKFEVINSLQTYFLRKFLMKSFIAIVSAVVLLAACGQGESGSNYFSQGQQETTSQFLEVTASDCNNISVADTSVFTPTSWDLWCSGFLTASLSWNTFSRAEKVSMCDLFWNSSDQSLLNSRPSYQTRDEAIGAIDFLWKNC